MPRDPKAVSRDTILDNCELYDRGQISLTVLVLNLQRALADLGEPDHSDVAVHLVDLQGLSELPDDKQRFQAQNLTRAIRKLLFRAP